MIIILIVLIYIGPIIAVLVDKIVVVDTKVVRSLFYRVNLWLEAFFIVAINYWTVK